MTEPDPAHVNARVAELLDRHPEHWRVPEAVQEAIGLWGGGCNDSGVFTRYERVEIARPSDSCHAAVLIAKGGNGLFGYGLEYQFGTGGGCVAPSVWREAFGSRDEARAAAVADLTEHLRSHGNGTPDRRQHLLLSRVLQNGRQRTLFD